MRLLSVLIWSLVLLSPSFALDWPNRVVRIIVPFGPGGSGDLLARLAADHLSAAFKQQFVVENRAGAGGLLGTQMGAKAEPDGYTLTLTNVSSLVLIPLVNRNTPYDAIKDFTHIAFLAGAPAALNITSAPQTLDQFIAYAKSLGRPLTFGSTGVGSDGHIVGEAIGRALGLKVQHVPYQGSGPATADLLGGRIDYLPFTIAQSGEAIRAGTIHGLAISSLQRMSSFPAIPTFTELGYKELVTSTWFSLSGPAKLPREIAEAINREIAVMLKKPEVVARFAQLGFATQPMSVDEFAAFVAEDSARWKPMVEASGLLGTIQ